jgi:hypothetical protein
LLNKVVPEQHMGFNNGLLLNLRKPLKVATHST